VRSGPKGWTTFSPKFGRFSPDLEHGSRVKLARAEKGRPDRSLHNLTGSRPSRNAHAFRNSPCTGPVAVVYGLGPSVLSGREPVGAASQVGIDSGYAGDAPPMASSARDAALDVFATSGTPADWPWASRVDSAFGPRGVSQDPIYAPYTRSGRSDARIVPSVSLAVEGIVASRHAARQ
jgi:hypothetical protein